MSILNHRLSDFIRIHSIVFRDDLSIAVNFSINGIAQDITVTVNDYSIADDGSWICIRKASSSVAGIDNAITAFVLLKHIPIPKEYAPQLAKIKFLL